MGGYGRTNPSSGWIETFVMMVCRRALCVAALVWWPLAAEAQAGEVTGPDLQVIGRAMSFKNGPRRASMSVAIVYDARNAS